MEFSRTTTPGVLASKPMACTQPPPAKLSMVLFRITKPELFVLPFPLLT